jgi:hypothetical protein
MNNQIKSSGNQYDSQENALVCALSYGDGHQYEVIEIRIKYINWCNYNLPKGIELDY